MYTLYIDTHMHNVIIVIYKNGKLLQKIEKDSNQSHSVLTMPAIEEILQANNIDIKNINDIIVVNGPGSFTGVRIGVTIAKTMAYCLNAPIRVISSLEVLVASIDDKSPKIVAINDRNGYFVGVFDENDNLIEEYKYLSNQEYNIFKQTNMVIDQKIITDYDKIYEFAINKQPMNPHLVNPLYVKKIEVQK